MLRLFLFFCTCISTQSAFSQESTTQIEYNTLLKLKVDADRFKGGRGFRRDLGTTPWFRDYTNNDIQTQFIDSKKDSVIQTFTDPDVNSLKIIPEQITIDKKTKLFQITGQITGAWDSVIPFEFGIYIGKRVDTISNITVSPSLHRTIYYNGVKVDTTIIIGVVPAFYLSNYKKFDAYRGDKNLPNSEYKEIRFKISAVIDDKSILTFGLIDRYAEIFEIGKLLSVD